MVLCELKMNPPPQWGLGAVWGCEDVSVMLSDGFICPQRLCPAYSSGPLGRGMDERVQENCWELQPVRLVQSCVFCQTLEVGRVGEGES